MTSKNASVQVTETNLADYLGVAKYRYGEVEANDRIGIGTGLDRGRWRTPTHRRRDDARQRQDDRHRQLAGCHERIDLSGSAPQYSDVNGGRTRTQTLDPLIKRQDLSV
jgi:hypothetical protein